MDFDINALIPHPLALLYDRDQEGLEALASSIAIDGMREEVVVQGNLILDGNRRTAAYKLAVAAGARPPGGYRCRQFNERTDGDVWDFVLLRNSHRRDAPRGKRAHPVLREELLRNHHKSDRAVALRTRCHHTDVRAVRAEMEEAGLIPRNAHRVDARGGDQVPLGRAPAAAPPPDAGDAWEPPEPGSPEAREDRAAKEAARAEYDMAGNLLPRHLRDAFADTYYDDAVENLAWILRHVESDPRLYVRLHVKPADKPFVARLKEFLAEARSVLGHHKPGRICPDCGGLESGCAACFSTGWLSAGQAKEREAHGEP